MSLLRPALRLARAPLARPLARFASSSAEAAVVPAEELNLKPQPAAPAQSPNVPTPWSDNQEPKKDAFNQARFEQTDYALQPDGLSAMGLVSEQPVVKVQGRKAVCNGGGGALGHPQIWINLDMPGPRTCGYCGARYEQEHHH